MPTRYRLSPAAAVRLAGGVAVLAGTFVLLLVLLVATLPLPKGLLGAGVVLAVGTVVAVALLTRRADLVRLDESGYQVRFVRGAGVKQAPWRDVEDVVATTVEGERCVQLRLRDGRSTVIPVDLLAGPTDGFVRNLQQHLNRGHGYRPVR